MSFLQRQAYNGLQYLSSTGSSRRSRVVPPVASSNGSNGVQWERTDVYGTTAVLGPSMNADGAYSMPEGKSEPPSPEVEAILAEQGLDLEISGLKYLNNEGRVCCLLKG